MGTTIAICSDSADAIKALSKTEHSTGAGLHCKDTEIFVSLGTHGSVFQAEVHAIELAIRECIMKGHTLERK